MDNLSILVFIIEYSDNWETYSANWMNCKFSDQLVVEIPEGSTVGDLCKKFESKDQTAYMMDPYISFTAEGKLKTAKPTKFYDGMVKPVDKNKVLNGTEAFHLIKSNQNGSNIENFLYI